MGKTHKLNTYSQEYDDKVDAYVTKAPFGVLFYCIIQMVTQRWTRDQLNQFTNCPLFSPLLLISSIIDDNPFIQDDDECSPLYTLSGKLDGAIDAVLDPVV